MVPPRKLPPVALTGRVAWFLWLSRVQRRRARKRNRRHTTVAAAEAEAAAAAVRETVTSGDIQAVTLEEILALPPSETRPFYPRVLLPGTRSIKEAKPWKCFMCGYVNELTRHFLYNLPAFQCKRCGADPREGDADFGFCFADLAVNDVCPIGHVKQQEPGECIANALASTVEINHRIMMTILEQPLSRKGPVIGIEDLISKYNKKWLEEGRQKIDGYNGYSFLTMIRVFQTDGVKEVDEEHGSTSKLHKISDWGLIKRDDFVAISSALADGYPLIFGFLLGARVAYLEPGEIYMPPPEDSVSEDGKRKPEGHFAVLVGAHQENEVKFLYFLNCWDEKFCTRSNDEGDGIRGGVGAITADGLCFGPI